MDGQMVRLMAPQVALQMVRVREPKMAYRVETLMALQTVRAREPLMALHRVRLMARETTVLWG